MNPNRLTTPVSRLASSTRGVATKRDSLAAELERDPQHSTAKRQQRIQALSSSMAHNSSERQLVAAQCAKAELEKKLREKDAHIERLESDRRWLAEREKEEREEKERVQAEHLEAQVKAEAEIRTLRTSLFALQEEHADLEEKRAAFARSTSQTISSQKSQIATLTHQVSLLQGELGELKRLSEERSRAFEDLQAQFDELSSASDASFVNKDSEADYAVVRAELQRQATYMRQLETSNAKMSQDLTILREKQMSVEVLKEQKRELERRVGVVDELQEKVVRLEAQLDASRREREEWANTSVEPATPSKTPVSVTQSLANLRLSHARLLEEHGSQVAILRHKEQELAEVQAREVEAQESLSQLRTEVRALKDQATRSEHNATLAEREISFLRAMIASYTAEDATQGVQGGASSEAVEQLEALVEDYRNTVAELQQELDDMTRQAAAPGPDSSVKNHLLAEVEAERAAKLEAEQALKEAEAASEKQLEQIEELEQTLFELRGEIGAGRHLPPGVRVLCMKDNPAQQWEDLSQAAMDRLKSENEALLRRLKSLEDSGVRDGGDANHADLVPRESYEAMTAEKERAEEELKQKEKRLLRLQQVFKAKSEEFREAISSILGVKLAFYPNGQVRVTSQFDLNAAFVFQPAARGQSSMQLVAQSDGGPEELPQLMRYWVEQEQCIPGFLASITLECYEKNKMERSQG